MRHFGYAMPQFRWVDYFGVGAEPHEIGCRLVNCLDWNDHLHPAIRVWRTGSLGGGLHDGRSEKV